LEEGRGSDAKQWSTWFNTSNHPCRFRLQDRGSSQELLQSVVDRPTARCRLCGAAELGVEVNPARCAYCTQIRPPFLDIATFLGPFFCFNSEPINLPPTLQVGPNRHRCRQAGNKREALKVDGMTSATCERKIPCRDRLIQPLNAALEP